MSSLFDCFDLSMGVVVREFFSGLRFFHFVHVRFEEDYRCSVRMLRSCLCQFFLYFKIFTNT